MEPILILNGSPRAPKSNSKRYAELFAKAYKATAEYHNITKTNHTTLCARIADFSNVLLVFPLYADALPVTLLHFLTTLEQNPPANKPTLSVLINCGFLEPQQNDTALAMLRLFCRQNGYTFGSALKIGAGEAILTTPFRFLAKRGIKKLAVSIKNKANHTVSVTMPISKTTFIKAAAKYWTNYARKYGVTPEEMQTMQIE